MTGYDVRLRFIRDWLFERLIQPVESGPWQVRIVDGSTFFRRRRDRKNATGLLCGDCSTVFINGCSHDDLMLILLHECVHIIFEDAIVDNTPPRWGDQRARDYSEDRTMELEEELFYALTSFQRRRLFRCLAKAKRLKRRSYWDDCPGH